MPNIFLTRNMRDLLIEHLDGRIVTATGQADRRSARALLRRGFLNSALEGGYGHKIMVTRITPEGRAALARGLAEWAEELVMARMGKHPEPATVDSESFGNLIAAIFQTGVDQAST